MAFVVVAAAKIEFCIAPYVIHSQINPNPIERWDGRAGIESIGFNWAGSVRIDGIDLHRPICYCLCKVRGGQERTVQP